MIENTTDLIGNRKLPIILLCIFCGWKIRIVVISFKFALFYHKITPNWSNCCYFRIHLLLSCFPNNSLGFTRDHADPGPFWFVNKRCSFGKNVMFVTRELASSYTRMANADSLQNCGYLNHQAADSTLCARQQPAASLYDVLSTTGWTWGCAECRRRRCTSLQGFV